MPVDYSKWKNIEVSDDEDDTHPNIDTPSLFRWRHQARVERQAESEYEKSEFAKGKELNEQKKADLKKKLKEADEKNNREELAKLQIEEKELKKQEAEFAQKEEELKKKERLTPWNVDTLSKEKFAKTIINTTVPEKKLEDMTDEERSEKYRVFLDKNKAKIKHFGMLKHYEDSKKFLMENYDLVCEDTANYLVVWCIDLELEEKKDLMEHISHQCIVMQFILELSKTLKQDPRACVKPFFDKLQLNNKDYMAAFYDELNSFKCRIRKRAQEKLADAMEEAEAEEREKRLGPGGLDPVEVFEKLPEILQQCFESQNIELLQEALLKMDKKDAEFYLDQCIKSGLWVPNAKEAAAAAAKKAEEEAEVYENDIEIETTGETEPSTSKITEIPKEATKDALKDTTTSK